MHLYRLLIADDEPIIRRGLKNSIPWKELGYEVTGIFSSGTDLIHFLEDNAADVVLTDIAMENGTGLQIASWVDNNRPLIRVVLITGYNDYNAAKEAISYQCVESLVDKPVAMGELKSLFARIRASFDERQQQLTHSSQMWMESLHLLLNNRIQKPKLWSLLGMRCVVLQCMQSFQEAPNLFSEQLQYAFCGMRYPSAEGAVCLYPCDAAHVDYFTQAANEFISFHPDFSEAEILAFETDSELLNYLTEQDGTSENNVLPEFQQALDAYIASHLAEKITLNDAARYMHYSPNYFSKKFKEIVGIGFTAYLMEFRMRNAEEKLLHSEASIAEIASSVGMDDIHYFSRVFKINHDISPAAYRRKEGGKHDA